MAAFGDTRNPLDGVRDAEALSVLLREPDVAGVAEALVVPVEEATELRVAMGDAGTLL